MELSVKDEQRERIEQEIYESAVALSIEHYCTQLLAGANAIYELVSRLRSGNLEGCRRNNASELACAMLDHCDVQYGYVVGDVCEEIGYETVCDEQLVDRVSQEVSRRKDGLSELLG